MYVAMSKSPKPERVNIRIDEDIKQNARIVAEMRRWDLTTLITTLLDQAIQSARQTPAAFEEAAKRLEGAGKPQRRTRTNRPVVSIKGDGGKKRKTQSNRE